MAALKELTVFKSLNSDGTNYHMSRPRCVKRAKKKKKKKKKNIINKMKNIINIWNRKVISISKIVMINLLME